MKNEREHTKFTVAKHPNINMISFVYDKTEEEIIYIDMHAIHIEYARAIDAR